MLAFSLDYVHIAGRVGNRTGRADTASSFFVIYNAPERLNVLKQTAGPPRGDVGLGGHRSLANA